MLPSFIIDTTAKIGSQLIRTTTNSIKKALKTHERQYFAKITSQTMQIPKIIIPKDTIWLSQQMLPPFNIGTTAKRRFQIIRTTPNSTKNVARKLVAFRHSGVLLVQLFYSYC